MRNKNRGSKLPFPTRVKAELPTALILSYVGYEHQIVMLMKSLNSLTVEYLESINMLNKYVVIAAKVNFSELTLGQSVDDTHPSVIDYEEEDYPSRSVTRVDPGLRIAKIESHDFGGAFLWNLRLTYNDGQVSQLIGN